MKDQDNYQKRIYLGTLVNLVPFITLAVAYIKITKHDLQNLSQVLQIFPGFLKLRLKGCSFRPFKC